MRRSLGRSAAVVLLIAAGSARSEDPKPGDLRERFDRAVAGARRELGDEGPPALVATVASRAMCDYEALCLAAARTRRDEYVRSGYDTRIRELRAHIGEAQHEIEQFKDRLFNHFAAEAERKTAPSRAEQNAIDRRWTVLALEYSKAKFHMEKADTELHIFDTYLGPKHRNELDEQVTRAFERSSRAEAAHLGSLKLLRRKLDVLGQLGSVGADAMSRQARRDAPKADLPRAARASAEWLMATSALARSLVAGP